MCQIFHDRRLSFPGPHSLTLNEQSLTRYSRPDHKISGELKSCNSVWMYPPLWTCLLVAMHDDIENRSITQPSINDGLERHINYSLSPGFWQSFISIEVCRDCIPALASSCKKQLTGFFVCLLFFFKVKRIS